MNKQKAEYLSKVLDNCRKRLVREINKTSRMTSISFVERELRCEDLQKQLFVLVQHHEQFREQHRIGGF